MNCSDLVIGALLWAGYWTFGFCKMLVSFWVVAQLAVSQLHWVRLSCHWYSLQPAWPWTWSSSPISSCPSSPSIQSLPYCCCDTWGCNIHKTIAMIIRHMHCFRPYCNSGIRWAIRTFGGMSLFRLQGKYKINIKQEGRSSWPIFWPWRRKQHVFFFFSETWTCSQRTIRKYTREQCNLLGCDAVWPLQEPTFQRNVSLPSSAWIGKTSY
jgi:hypothetical protein